MDRPVNQQPLARRLRIIGPSVLVSIIAIAAFTPSILRWYRSEASIDVSRIRIAEVVRGDLVREFSVEGRIVAAFHPTSFSPARGIVTVNVTAGQVVNEGDILARVASPELGSLMAQEETTLNSLQSTDDRLRLEARQNRMENEQQADLGRVELAATTRSLERAEKLYKLGLTNEIDLEAARDSVVVASLKLKQAEQRVEFGSEILRFELENAQQQLERQRLVVDELERRVEALTIRAPVAGLVSRLHVDDRKAVNTSDPLITVVDLSAYEVEIAIAESYSNEIDPGTEAVILKDGIEYPAHVLSISPEVEGSRVKGRVGFTGTLPEGLRQNQRVTARLILDTRPDVLKVARGPFLEDGNGRLAFVIDDGIAIKRPITTGSTSISEVEIVSGLEIGDRIIISDINRFEDAENVLLR
ncbi:MAG: HlyD family efflux transporter periplasmic adaptor subunit [Acidobacteriota bacterium]